MGTAKRERQKAGRQARLERLEEEQRRKKTRTTIVRLVLALAAFLAVAFVLTKVFGGDDTTPAAGDSSTTVADGSSTTVAGDTSTTAATDTSVTETTVPKPFEFGTTACPPADGSASRTTKFDAPFQKCIDETKTYLAEFDTTKGKFTVELDPKAAPGTVNNFVALARYHFYDGVTFHRIIPGFVVQGGDAVGNPPGTGGPGYEIADELPAAGAYQLGSLAMANSGPNTNGSQFFVITGDQGASLPPSYSLFGKVTDGFDTTVKALEKVGTESGTPSETVKMNTVTITEK